MLRRQRAAVIHATLRAVRVEGRDARAWLHDLVTADVASLPAGALRASLLLSPTGRIRAAFSMAMDDRGFLLLQESDQPDLGAMLAPYVLSSAVAIDRDPRTFTSLPDAAIEEPGAPAWRPSLVPSRTPWGAVIATDGAGAARTRLASAGVAEATSADADHLRVEEGIARFPVDLDDTSLPAEAGWEDRIDLAKGCFLGQESVAKVRNLGHPPRVVRAFATDRPVAVGDAILADRDVVGTVTSAVETSASQGRCIARVRWDARDAQLATSAGVALRPA